MSCGLFSSFDPCVIGWGWLSKWLLLGVGGLFSFWQLFTSHSANSVWKAFQVGLFEAVKPILPFKGGFILLWTLFSLILLWNEVGMVVFSPSAHLSITLSLSLPLWWAGVSVNFWTKFKEAVAHLLPEGSPGVLWGFLVVVESVSFLIRPFTLAVRLMANVMAGHLILSLMEGAAASFPPLFPVGGAFFSFEVGVAVVQAFVFFNLLTLYWSE